MESLQDDRPEVECDHAECRPLLVKYRRQGPYPGVRDGSYLRLGRIDGSTCVQPLQLVMSCHRMRERPCDVRDSDRCAPCAERNNRRLRRKFEEGIRTAAGYVYLVTLTAPGEVGHQRFVPGVRGRHGVCGCESSCPDLAAWNEAAAGHWNHLATLIRRRYPGTQYARVAEVQKRGAIHHHIPIAFPEPVDVAWLHAAALAAGYGCVIDVDPVKDPAQVAAYIAKYTTKGGRDRTLCKWSKLLVDVETGEVTRERCWPTYRAWSSSRDFGPTIAYLRSLAREQAQSRARQLRDLEYGKLLRSEIGNPLAARESDPDPP
jgi:hypothetical protein